MDQLWLGIIVSGISFVLRPTDVFARKRSANAAAAADVSCTESVATGTNVFCAKA
ncbi:hypothetical protein [Lysinibacillus xylanilyticus]|uniref:hypothetical protein n=1 Tax=Lysinibacillus xylanilyticus TaxID=582475 RepID=UPI00380810A0